MRIIVLIFCSLLVTVGSANAEGALPVETYQDFEVRLASFALNSNSETRDAALDEFWSELVETGRVPFVDGQKVAFLYRGEAQSVAFAGDFNGWDYSAGPAERMIGTDIWRREETFPADSRLDYKIVINGKQWILDPANPHLRRSGFGDNSELAMPDYVPSPWAERNETSPRGELAAGFLSSEHLGYPVNYQVYTPVGYESLSNLPVMYVTDGHEYADDVMGSMCAVMDNLIAAGKIRPMMAVFIDPRVYGQNRRSQQYVLNPKFVDFVAKELVPHIDAHWKTSADRRDRGILGTSLGGLNSAYFAVRAPETFTRIAVQSPAFQAGGGRIRNLYREAPRLDIDLFMTWGTFHDFDATTTEFRQILDQKGYEYRHILVNEGHSWGNWRALLDDILLAFWPAEAEGAK